MNTGNLDTCERMQRLYALLRAGRVSSMQIAQHIPCVAPSTEVSALRHNLKRKPRDGYNDVLCEREGPIWYYTLSAREPEQLDLVAA